MNPHIKDGGLIIPFTSEPKYHWWKSGQSILLTLGELNATAEVFKGYGHKMEPSGETCKCGKPAGGTTEVFYCAICGGWWARGSVV